MPLTGFHRFVPGFVLCVAAGGLGGLFFGLGAESGGMRLLTTDPGARVDYFVDPDARMTVAPMAAKPDAAWTSWDGRGFMSCRFGQALWVRVTLRNPGAEPRHGVLADSEFYADRAELFTRDSAGEWRWQVSGEKTPAAEKALPGRDTAFPVIVPAHGTLTAYWRLEDRFGIWLRPVWWPGWTGFVAARTHATLVSGLYFGALLALLFYNAVLWARGRFADTGRYLLYVGATGAFMAVARSEALTLGWPLGSPAMETLLMVLLALSGAALAGFARGVLDLPQRAPRADRAVQAVRLLMHGLALVSLATPWLTNTGLLRYVIPGYVLALLVVTLAAGAAWRAGAAQARYFLAAFGVYFLGALPTAWIWVTVVPLEEAWFGEPALLTGSILQLLLLAMAVADRFARLQQEKETLQEAYADDLELEVRERTGELEAANADKDRMLLLLGHDLRSPLTALTQTAEQVRARPGDPAGGFAGEVADAGRQLLLLIEDIVLWARLRTGAEPAAVAHALVAVVDPVVRLHGPLAARRGVTVAVHVSARVEVRTDLVLAQALVRNLVGNAVKFAATRVEVAAQAGADGVTLVVRDDGPGLPEEVQAQLAHGRPGTERGFGLRLCREIATTLGLTLAARPAPEGGTELSVTLPAAGREAGT